MLNPTQKIRVLVVDDSIVIRRMLSEALSEDPIIEIAGVAANGKIALAKVPQVSPDIITLDMEMPEMDGLTTLVELQRLYPKIPVIMFSTLTQRGAEATFDALAKGAADYVTKPANVGSVGAAINNVRNELLPKLKALCLKRSVATPRGRSVRRPEPDPRATRVTGRNRTRAHVLAIGASTGGPNALLHVLRHIPQDFSVPIVIAQHMPPMFTKFLADRLSQACPISVSEATDGDSLFPGGAWIAPGGHHMTVRRERASVKIALSDDPPENSCRPAVDVLFRSVGEVYGPNVLATVLTGMGRDGLLGCRVIHDLGGHIIAQDEATSVVWGMPRAVSEEGLADQVLPLDAISDEWCLQLSEQNIRHIPASTGRNK